MGLPLGDLGIKKYGSAGHHSEGIDSATGESAQEYGITGSASRADVTAYAGKYLL